MKKRVNCPECGQEMNLMGLRWHRIAKHNIEPAKALVLPALADTQANALIEPGAVVLNQPQAVVEKPAEKPQEETTAMEQKKPEQPTGEHKHEESCPECKLRAQRILDLEQTALELRQQLENVPDEATASIPADLNAVIAHCESGQCESHKRQWDTVKARIVQGTIDNLPGELIPDKVVEAEGLRRGLIPKKIFIPVR